MFGNAVNQHQTDLFSGSRNLDVYMGKVCFMVFSSIKDAGFHLALPAVAKFRCRSSLVMIQQLPVGFDANHIILFQFV